MRQSSGYLAVVAMLVALLTGPLFHLHEHDDHGQHVLIVHAHFGESEVSHSHAGGGIDAENSHAQARWVDLFTFDAFSLRIEWPMDLAVTLPIPQLHAQEHIVMRPLPVAHGPPGITLFSPRPPPSV